MKLKLFTLIASAAAMTAASAFTIDFNTLQVSDGTTTTGFSIGTISGGSPQVVTVPGYGDVRFEVAPASSDVVQLGSSYSNDGGTTFQQSLEVDASEVVVVTFLGDEALNVDFDIIGISSGENTAPVKTGSQEYQYNPGSGGPSSPGDGAGIAAISWTAVPEPSSSLLVLVGAGSLLLRRRR